MLRANFGYVIINVDKNPDVTPGGIVIPQNSIKNANHGVVVDHGYLDEEIEEGKILDFTDYTIFFPPYSGHRIEHDGKEYLILKEDDILAFIEKQGSNE